jgi:hypothetical protein
MLRRAVCSTVVVVTSACAGLLPQAPESVVAGGSVTASRGAARSPCAPLVTAAPVWRAGAAPQAQPLPAMPADSISAQGAAALRRATRANCRLAAIGLR